MLLDQLCPTLCDPMDCSPPGSSVHGISGASILEWVAISFSRGSSRARNRTWGSTQGSSVSYVSLRWQVGSLPLVPPGKNIHYDSTYMTRMILERNYMERSIRDIFEVIKIPWLWRWLYDYELFFSAVLKKMYLFLAVLGLRCCAGFFSSCSEWGLLSGCGAWASHCRGFSWCGAQALGARTSLAVVHRISCSTACGIFLTQGLYPGLLHCR